MKKLAFIFLAMASATVASAQNLVAWNFNNSTAGSGGAPGSFNTTGTAEVYNPSTKTLNAASHGSLASSAVIDLSNLAGNMGGSSANNNWGDFGGTLVNAFSGDASGGALAVIGSGQNGHHVDFEFSTLGFDDLSISYATQRTGTGFTSQAWSFSTDGSTFTPVTTLTSLPSSFGLESFSLGSAADDQSLITLRLTLSGATGTSGNNRIDNFMIAGAQVPIPEPRTYAAIIASLSLLGAMIYRRRISSPRLIF